jgi:hypothetical protein
LRSWHGRSGQPLLRYSVTPSISPHIKRYKQSFRQFQLSSLRTPRANDLSPTFVRARFLDLLAFPPLPPPRDIDIEFTLLSSSRDSNSAAFSPLERAARAPHALQLTCHNPRLGLFPLSFDRRGSGSLPPTKNHREMADHSLASPAPPKNVQRGDYLVAFRTSPSVRPDLALCAIAIAAIA